MKLLEEVNLSNYRILDYEMLIRQYCFVLYRTSLNDYLFFPIRNQNTEVALMDVIMRFACTRTKIII